MSLKNLYGVMKIRKGTILYHLSDEMMRYKNENEKGLLYCVFHPSEYYGGEKYITFIKIKRNLSLLFRIDNIKDLIIYSALQNETNDNIVKKLKNENLDGWFSSINNRFCVEVAIINKLDNYEILKTKKIKKKWKKSYYKDGKVILKDWGNYYSIDKIEEQINMKINIRYKIMIKKYKKLEEKSEKKKEYILQILLNNCKIKYIKI